MAEQRTALLLIAHGSQRPEANADLERVAEMLRAGGRYSIVQVSYLELAEPSIDAGGRSCVERGATRMILLPYFLSPGKHVVEDLAAAQVKLAKAFPAVRVVLAKPIGPHPLLLDILEERVREAETCHW